MESIRRSEFQTEIRLFRATLNSFIVISIPLDILNSYVYVGMILEVWQLKSPYRTPVFACIQYKHAWTGKNDGMANI